MGASKVAPRTGETGRPTILFVSGPFISSQRSITPIMSVGASGRRSPSAKTASSIITPSLDGMSFVAKRTSFILFPFEYQRIAQGKADAWADCRQLFAVTPVQD